MTDADEPRTVSGARIAFDRAIAAYIDHLRVERGLARATLAAYGTDLRRFGDAAPGIEDWAVSAEPALGYLASLTRQSTASSTRTRTVWRGLTTLDRSGVR